MQEILQTVYLYFSKTTDKLSDIFEHRMEMYVLLANEMR